MEMRCTVPDAQFPSIVPPLLMHSSLVTHVPSMVLSDTVVQAEFWNKYMRCKKETGALEQLLLVFFVRIH